MQAITLQLNRLPLQITYLDNGCIIFDRMGNFNTIIDLPGAGIQAIISNDDIAIGTNSVVTYGTVVDYKNEPEVLAWLSAQMQVMPKFK